MPTSPALVVLPDLTVSADAPLDFNFPTLSPAGAICIGLSIDWRCQHALNAFALRHTPPDEHARAGRFLYAEDSLRYLLGRVLLRRLAAHYGGMDPMRPIGANQWGKPEPAGCNIGCNISHAGDQVWAAVSVYPRVGIDVESATAPPDFDDIAVAFHPDEAAALRGQSAMAAEPMRCWTRKEAVSKATGMGLSLPLHAYAVDCGVRSFDWLRIAPAGTRLEVWTTADMPVTSGYVGALAIEGRCERISVSRLNTVL